MECKVYVIYGLGFNDSFNGSGKIKLSNCCFGIFCLGDFYWKNKIWFKIIVDVKKLINWIVYFF